MVRSVRSDPIFRWTIENWFAGRTETETEGKKKKEGKRSDTTSGRVLGTAPDGRFQSLGYRIRRDGGCAKRGRSRKQGVELSQSRGRADRAKNGK